MRGRGERMRKKAEQRWTVMVVPHGSGSSRAVEVSQTFVKALIGIGSVVALTFLVLGVAAISRGVNITHSRALENENRLLADEIQRMRERMTGLRDTLHRFSEREQEARLLAGRTPTDRALQQAGNGGAAERREEGYGNIVTMDHGFGLVTRFAHCSKILVVRGQRVKRGQKIALVGSTGLSTGPHLHYEVWVNHKPVDPMKYVMPDAIVD